MVSVVIQPRDNTVSLWHLKMAGVLEIWSNIEVGNVIWVLPMKPSTPVDVLRHLEVYRLRVNAQHEAWLWCCASDNRPMLPTNSYPDARARPLSCRCCCQRRWAHQAGISREPDIWLVSADSIATAVRIEQNLLLAGCLDDYEARLMWRSCMHSRHYAEQGEQFV